jgi:hypothetical protein
MHKNELAPTCDHVNSCCSNTPLSAVGRTSPPALLRAGACASGLAIVMAQP